MLFEWVVENTRARRETKGETKGKWQLGSVHQAIPSRHTKHESAPRHYDALYLASEALC